MSTIEELTEKDYKNFIIKNYKKIDQFKEYEYLYKNVFIRNGCIDLFGRKSEMNILIELKMNSSNPTNQLIKYSKNFSKPFLIGITELPVGGKILPDKIKYMLFDELTIEGEKIDFQKQIKDNGSSLIFQRFQEELEKLIIKWEREEKIRLNNKWFNARNFLADELGYKDQNILYHFVDIYDRSRAKIGICDIEKICEIIKDITPLKNFVNELEKKIK